MRTIFRIFFLLHFLVAVSLAQKVSHITLDRNINGNKANITEFELEQDPYEGCTIGVAAGSGTSDGRPLLWKTRDSEAYNNEVVFNTASIFKFVSVISAGQSGYAWMGVNEHGFAIINSYSPDLAGGTIGYGNGSLMYYALGNCATVEDFENLLNTTNDTGRRTQANFGVIDASGAAAIYETGGDQYWKYDANDTLQAPDGYVLRTNFAINGGGSGGIERYKRTQKLIRDFHSGDTLCYKSILRTQMRDFSDYESEPISIPFISQWATGVPFGYIDTQVSICRAKSVSTAVIHGVLPGESPLLSTMWTILGQPATAIAVPYWPVGSTPASANGNTTAPLCDIANEIWSELFDWSNLWYINTHRLRDEYGEGIWCQSFSAEDSICAATDSLLNIWRSDTMIVSQMLAAETEFANYAYIATTDCYNRLAPDMAISSPTQFILKQNYPNPFNPTTTIDFTLPQSESVELKVFNILGKQVATLVSNKLNSGNHTYTFDGKNLASGVYYYQLVAGDYREVKKMILLR